MPRGSLTCLEEPKKNEMHIYILELLRENGPYIKLHLKMLRIIPLQFGINRG